MKELIHRHIINNRTASARLQRVQHAGSDELTKNHQPVSRLLLLVLLIMIHLSLSAQIDERKDFVYFFNDSVLYGNVEFKSMFLDYDHILVNSKKISLDKVKFYNNSRGFYANAKNLKFSGSSSFYERVEKGKINLYEEISTSYNHGHFTPSGGYVGGGSYTRIVNFYNIGYGDLKKATYKNMMIDLADDPASLEHLLKYKNLTTTQTVFSIVGGAAVIGGLATLINKTSGLDEDESSPDLTANIVALAGGSVCFTVSYVISLTKPRHLHHAVNTYNRNMR